MLTESIQLPIAPHKLTVYPDEAALLSILYFSQNGLYWIYNNFHNIYSYKNEDNIYLTYYCFKNSKTKVLLKSCTNCLDYKEIDRKKYIYNPDKMLCDIVEGLKKQYYIMIISDRFYLPVMPQYHIEHFLHHMFIYGYNANNNTLQFADFVSGKYKHFNANADDVILSVKESINVENCPLIFFKLKRSKSITEDFTFLKKSIEDFLNSICHYQMEGSFYEKTHITYGKNIYDDFMNYYRNNYVLHLHDLFTSLLYKRLDFTLERIEFLNQNKIIETSEKLYETYLKARYSANLLVRINIKRNMYLASGTNCDDILFNKKVLSLVNTIKELELYGGECFYNLLTQVGF